MGTEKDTKETQAQTVDEYITELKMKLAGGVKRGDHESVTTLYNLGVAYLSKRMWQEAERAFREVVEKIPRFAEAYVQLGGICLHRGDIEGCLNLNEIAKSYRPEFAAPFANMGFCYLQMGEVEKAMDILKKAINRDPKFVQAFATLGSAHLMSGDVEGCIEYCKRAVDIAPAFGPTSFSFDLRFPPDPEKNRSKGECRFSFHATGEYLPESH
ncbi:MAG: tetratricopeptide repeat protein [Thermodesulfobacteriota bacterium]|nr:tetratricopeptide repeat protein [Thermodesulfobacteriota bacterium]